MDTTNPTARDNASARAVSIARFLEVTHLLAALGLLVLVLIAIAALYHAQQSAAQDRQLLHQGNQAADTARRAQVHFKIQVQEWKNVLLRGHDPALFTRYLDQFKAEGALVHEELLSLTPLIASLGVDEATSQLLEMLLDEHAQLEVEYLEVLHWYELTDNNAYRLIDHHVRGIDRAPTMAMDRLVEGVMNRVKELNIQFESRDRQRFQLTVAILLLLPPLFFLAILPFSHKRIRREIAGPIQKAASAMSAIAQGDLDRTVPVAGCQEVRELGETFNDMRAVLKETRVFLQQEREILTTIILGAREGIVVTDRAGSVVLVNPAAERLLEKDAREIATQGLLHITDEPGHIEALLQGQRGDAPEIAVYKGRVLQLYVETIRDHEGVAMGSTALIRDVTEEKRLQAKLRHLSITDGLTGLYNRRRLDELLTAEISRAGRYGQPLSLLLLDVDHFKAFNDQHGHDTGDRILVALGACMRDLFRDCDYPCRYGGEEFAAILPSVGLPGALDAAERLRGRVEAMTVDDRHRITVSVGVAVHLPGEEENPEGLLSRADIALYAAKEAGRNRVRHG